MALDPSIILQGRQAPNALDSQGRVLKLRQLQMANDEAERGIADRETVANLYRNNIDASGNVNAAGITQGLAQAGMGDRIPEFQTGQAKYGHAVAQMNAQQVEFHKKQLDAVNGSLASLLAKPDLTHDDVIQQISSLVDNGIIDNAAGAAMVKQLPGPDQLRPFLLQKAVEGLDQSKRMELLLPKYDEQDRGDVINQGTVNPLTGARTAGTNVKKGATPGERLVDARNPPGAGFTGASQALLAALASKGVSLPSGFRSQAQMAATLAGLIQKFPDKTPDQIADGIATGQINFGAEKKETTTAAGQAGRVAVAVNELSTFGDQVLEASNAIPRGSFIPLNKLIQMTDAQLSDPALINLKTKMQALNNAYDQLAARGGTDAEKRAHIAKLFQTATGPEGVAALVKAVKDEGAAAEEAARRATKRRPQEDVASDVPPDIAAILKKHGSK
jgi:hypothetical protein